MHQCNENEVPFTLGTCKEARKHDEYSTTTFNESIFQAITYILRGKNLQHFCYTMCLSLLGKSYVMCIGQVMRKVPIFLGLKKEHKVHYTFDNADHT